MFYSFKFNEEKNQLLKATRNVCFEEIIKSINDGKLITIISNINMRRSHQKLFVVEFNNYVYGIPYVQNDVKKEIFLKTIYPSRSLTKKYGEAKK